MSKICTYCKIEKGESEFYLKSDKLRSQCKICSSRNSIINYQNNKESRQKTNKIWRDNNKQKIHAIFLKARYGLQIGEFNNMLEKQNYRCAICNEENYSKKNFHIDHDHKTGKIRGLLCYKCNSSMGLLNDDISILEKAIKYLQKHKEKQLI